jgi:HEPN domain-containing protein
MLNELFQQGIRYVENALFVRDHFIPVAFSQEHWNIAVYETHRATELLIRGWICQMGFKPPEHHDIKRLVSFLYDRFPGARASVIPFTVGAYTDTGEGYGVILEGDAESSIRLFRLDNGVFTQLGYTYHVQLSEEGRFDLQLKLNSPQVMVYLNSLLVLTTTDNSYHGPLRIIDRSFVRHPDTAKSDC